MKRFKKGLSITLAFIMTVLSSLPVGAADTSKDNSTFKERLVEAFKQNKQYTVYASMVGGGLFLVSLLTGFYLFGNNNSNSNVGEHSNSNASSNKLLPEITVGTEGKSLTIDDLDAHSKKETAKLTGIIPSACGFADNTYTVSVVRASNVEVRDGVTSIEKRAFGHCTGIMNIIIPDSVTKIDETAFSSSIALFTPIIRYRGVTYRSPSEFLKAFKQLHSSNEQ